MTQKDIIVPNVKIKHKAVFSLKELYKMLYRWFETRGYIFQEKEYKDEESGPTTKTLEIKWYTEKEVDDYFKFVIELQYLVLGLESAEVEEAGVKRETNRGEIEFRVKSYILRDWQNKWERGFLKLIRGIYEKYIISARIEGYEDEIYEETYKLMDEIKAFLNIHRF